jgi:putative transposase
MTNHIHFVAVPGNKHSISKTFHRCHTVYATKFNEKYAVTGHLWQGRPYSSVLDETHLWAAVRYVELNPVRAGIVSQAQDYPWSSARAHCKLIQDRLIESGWPSPGLINDWSAWLHDVDSPAADKRIRETTFKGQPCGDDEFVAWLSSALGRSLGKKKPGPKVKRIDSRE